MLMNALLALSNYESRYPERSRWKYVHVGFLSTAERKLEFVKLHGYPEDIVRVT